MSRQLVTVATDDFTTDTSDKNIDVYDASWVYISGSGAALYVQHTTDLVRVGTNGVENVAAFDEVFDDNQYAIGIASSTSTSHATGVAVRASGTTAYVLTISSTKWFVGRAVAGVFTILAQNTTQITGSGQPHTLRLEVEDDLLIAYVNDVQVASITDATYTSGDAGIHGYRDTTPDLTTLDDWEGGSIVYLPEHVTAVRTTLPIGAKRA